MQLTELIQRLNHLNLQIRAQLDQADACVPRINEVVQKLADLGMVSETALMGHVVHERQYAPSSGNSDSQVLQAALLIPKGIGIVLWSSDHYHEFRESCGKLDSDTFVHFVPFTELEPAIRALLLPHLESLVQRLVKTAIPRGY